MSINCSYKQNDSITIKYKCSLHEIVQCEQDPTYATLFYAKQILKSEIGTNKKYNTNKKTPELNFKELSHFFGID